MKKLNYKIQSRRILRFSSYLVELLENRNFVLNDVNIKNNNLLKKFRLSKSTYYSSIKYYELFKILTVHNENYSEKNKIAKTYNVNLKKLFLTFVFFEIRRFRKNQLDKKLSKYKYKSNLLKIMNILANIEKSIDTHEFYVFHHSSSNLEKVINEYLNLYYYTISILLRNGSIRNTELYNELSYIKEYRPSNNKLFKQYNNHYPNQPLLILYSLPPLHYESQKYLLYKSHEVYMIIFTKIKEYNCNETRLYNFFSRDYSEIAKINNYFDFEPCEIDKNDLNINTYKNDDFESFYYYRSPLMSYAVNLIKYIKSKDKNYYFNISATLEKHKTHYTISLTGRQTSIFCNISKEERKKFLIDNLYFTDENYCEFDLHAAIHVIARIINKNEFNADYDIKQVLAKCNFTDCDNMPLTIDDYKIILRYLFFCDSIDSALVIYDKFCKNEQHFKKRIDENTFNNIANIYKNEIGDIRRYRYNIYILESIYELLVIKRMIDNNLKIVNVFDCFIFNKDELSIEEFKDILNDTAKSFYSVIRNIKKESFVSSTN